MAVGYAAMDQIPAKIDVTRCPKRVREVGSGRKEGWETSGLNVSSLYGRAPPCPVPGLERIDL